MTIPESSFPSLPMLTALGGVLVLAVAAQVRGLRDRAGDVALLAFALVAAATVAAMDAVPAWIVDHRLAGDPFAAFFHFHLALAAAAGAWLLARSSGRDASASRPDPWAWVAFAASLVGMQGMAASTDFLALWAGFELTGVSCALWLAGQGTDARQVGAAALLRSSFASAMLLAGFALLAGITGSTDYAGLASHLTLAPSMPGGRAAVFTGIAMVVAALASRPAILPWPLWPAGDGERLPLPVLAWLTVGGSLAGLAAMGRFLGSAVTLRDDAGAWTSPVGLDWAGPLAAAAVATAILGGVAVLRESNLRRLFAWIAVSHAGWVAIGLSTAGTHGLESAMVAGVGNAVALTGLAAAFSLATTGADAGAETGDEDIDAIRGLARHNGAARLLAAAIALFLASLAGVPPLAGWPVRSGLFHAVLGAGSWTLVAGATIAGVVGWLGLVRVVAILLDRGARDVVVRVPDADAMLLVGVLAAAVIGLGLAPSGLAAFAARSVVFFGG